MFPRSEGFELHSGSSTLLDIITEKQASKHLALNNREYIRESWENHRKNHSAGPHAGSLDSSSSHSSTRLKWVLTIDSGTYNLEAWDRGRKERGHSPRTETVMGTAFLCSQAYFATLELAGAIWKSSSNLLAPVGICLWELTHPSPHLGSQSLLDNNLWCHCATGSHCCQIPQPFQRPAPITVWAAAASLWQEVAYKPQGEVTTEGAYPPTRGSRLNTWLCGRQSAFLIPWDIYRKPPFMLGDGADLPNAKTNTKN